LDVLVVSDSALTCDISRQEVNGAAVENPAEALLYPKAKGFATYNPVNGLHKEKTPGDYKKLNEKGPTEEGASNVAVIKWIRTSRLSIKISLSYAGPRLRWCKWATQLVPCALYDSQA